MSDSASESHLRFELIALHHDISSFDCLNMGLNNFLHIKALVETQQNLSRTYVLLDEDTVIGYFTLRADAINYSLPDNSGFVSLPAVELSYLARHIAWRGHGLGDVLLIEAMRYVVEAAKWIAIAGLHLAYTQEGKPLYEKYGFGEHPYGEWLLLLPLADVENAVEIADSETNGTVLNP